MADILEEEYSQHTGPVNYCVRRNQREDWLAFRFDGMVTGRISS